MLRPILVQPRAGFHEILQAGISENALFGRLEDRGAARDPEHDAAVVRLPRPVVPGAEDNLADT